MSYKPYKPHYPSRAKALRVEYSVEVCYQLLSAIYRDVDKDYLKQYIEFCFRSNKNPSGFIAHKPHHQKPDDRYHHLYPKCLMPTMANSTTNLIVLSRKDHFDAHCLLVFAFRSYYHSTDTKKAQIFKYLVSAVGATLGQLPKRIQDACRTWFSETFFELTGKKIASLDKHEVWADYQTMRRSTPDGKAYDSLKGYVRYLTKKYQFTGEMFNSYGIPERAEYLIASVLLKPNENKKLSGLLAVYREAAPSRYSSGDSSVFTTLQEYLDHLNYKYHGLGVIPEGETFNAEQFLASSFLLKLEFHKLKVFLATNI